MNLKILVKVLQSCNYKDTIVQALKKNDQAHISFVFDL